MKVAVALPACCEVAKNYVTGFGGFSGGFGASVCLWCVFCLLVWRVKSVTRLFEIDFIVHLFWERLDFMRRYFKNSILDRFGR